MIAYDPIQLFDRGFGSILLPVTPPGCVLLPGTKLHPKHRGKAPGIQTQSGWTPIDLRQARYRCDSYETAKLWRDQWNANTGFACGDGYLFIDNDMGEDFSLVLREVFPEAHRKFVAEPAHKRDSFFLRIVDFVGGPVATINREMVFLQGMSAVKVSVLAQGKQSVVSGVHPETKAPYVWDRDLTSENVFTLSAEDFLARLIEVHRAGRALRVGNQNANRITSCIADTAADTGGA